MCILDGSCLRVKIVLLDSTLIDDFCLEDDDILKNNCKKLFTIFIYRKYSLSLASSTSSKPVAFCQLIIE